MICYRSFKRLVDLFFGSLGILLLSPIMVIVSISILIIQGSPIFFKQLRIGMNGRAFSMFKFCTMTSENDEKGSLLPDAKRITKLGWFLRKTSLDELPGLFNVITGDMSLVGPRPLLISYLPYYSEREKKRHLVKPGITGLAQVSGRNYLDWNERLELDVQYVEKQSFWFDMTILFKTIKIVLFSKGVAVDTAQVEPSLIEYRQNSVKNND